MKIAAVGIATMCLIGTLVAGDVTGKIAFDGQAPKPNRIRMNADPVCMKAHKDAVVSEEVVVNKNGTLKNVLVYVKDGLGGKTFPAGKNKVVFDQIGCVYEPHVLGIQTGQDLEVLNSDPTLHNVHSLSKVNTSFNQAMPMKGMKLTKKFDKVENFKVKCEVHPWMSAYIGVFNHPFFAVTGDDGSFTLKGVPAGDYTVEAWHEKYGSQTAKVKVDASGKATADFKFTGK
ncbi:MAG: carboxypeptidase regulatory-like domain-containing protein [Ignavibacteriales bacterium]|nr:carboxypeptidase regulatory-like domain-containing protein [Ignavibacteriales bacterium]